MKIASSIKPQPDISDGIRQVYDVSFLTQTISTTVTMNPYFVTQWINALPAPGSTGVRYVGFELEIDQKNSRIGTIQLCVGMQCLVFQLPHKPLVPSLDIFLGDKHTVFVGINISTKMEVLKEQCPYESLVQCMEIDEHLAEYRDAVQVTLGKTVEKDWDRITELSHRQVLFACLDAFLILFLGRWLHYG